MIETHKKPCKECPWRRDSLPGWLGADTPEGFLRTTLADHAMPCHLTIDYEQDDWEDQLDTASYCAGAANFFRNICKKSRDPFRPEGERDPSVFASPAEFIKHHTSLRKPKSNDR